MSDHARGNIERFQILLQQIQMTEDAEVVYFKHAAMDKVVVEKKARRWHFHFSFEKILPYRVYHRFTFLLEKAFSQIAAISYHIDVTDHNITPDLFNDYWAAAIQQLDGICSTAS